MLPVIINIALGIVIVVGGPLLWLYANERVKNLAREATEKALADYRHKHERELEEFGLYARQKYRVYPALYRHLVIAKDTFASTLGFSSDPDFQTFTREDAVEYLDANAVRGASRREVLRAFDEETDAMAWAELTTLHERVKFHRGMKAFGRAKSVEALHLLYLSDEVQDVLHDVRRHMADLSVAIDPDINSDRRRGKDEREALTELQTSLSRLYEVMREELRRE